LDAFSKGSWLLGFFASGALGGSESPREDRKEGVPKAVEEVSGPSVGFPVFHSLYPSGGLLDVIGAIFGPTGSKFEKGNVDGVYGNSIHPVVGGAAGLAFQVGEFVLSHKTVLD
jgi:hypothetical protein